MSIYTQLKVLHFKEKIESLPRDNPEILPPVHVRVKPTNVCNHSCRYCAYRAKDLQLGKDMDVKDALPREKMLEIVDDFISMGVKAVTFSGGGEPFCYPHLTEAAQRLAHAGIAIASLTNGGRLAGEAAEVFARNGVWVRVSMDGWDNESYARYRGVSEREFGRVLKNMADFKDLGGPCRLGVSYIVDRDNAGHVHEMVGRLRDVGVDSVKLAPCIIANSGAENNAYHQPVYDTVKEQAGRAIEDFQGENFEVFDSYHLLEDKFTKAYDWCPFLQILPVVGADQNVYSCQDKAYNLDCGLLGGIKGMSFKQFWMQGKKKFFSINPALHCNHHCVANNKNRLVLEYLSADPVHLPFV